MLKISRFDEVTRFDLARTIAGRGRYWTTAYLVDGMLVDTGCAHTHRNWFGHWQIHPWMGSSTPTPTKITLVQTVPCSAGVKGWKSERIRSACLCCPIPVANNHCSPTGAFFGAGQSLRKVGLYQTGL